MQKKLIEIASEIVQTQVSLSPMSGTDISLSLRQVFSTLAELQKAEAGEIELPKTEEMTIAGQASPNSLSPRESIQENKVVCLECGAEMKQLTGRHLAAHGLTPREYRNKYGLSTRTPLAARSLTKARSRAAKKRGLPANLVKAIEARRKSKATGASAGQLSGPGKTGGKREVIRRRKKAESSRA